MEFHEEWPFSDYPEELLIAPERELQLQTIATKYKIFPKFSLLPKELRTMIWDYTMLPRLVEIRSILHKDGYFYFRPCHRYSDSDYPVEQLSLVCAESKAFVRSRYVEIHPKNPFFHTPLRINPRKDILLFRELSDLREIRFGADGPTPPSYLVAFAKIYPQLAERLQAMSIAVYGNEMSELEYLPLFPNLQHIVVYDRWKYEYYSWQRIDAPELSDLEKMLQSLKAQSPKLKIRSIRLAANLCDIVYWDLQLGWPDGYVHPQKMPITQYTRRYRFNDFWVPWNPPSLGISWHSV